MRSFNVLATIALLVLGVATLNGTPLLGIMILGSIALGISIPRLFHITGD